MYSLAARLNVSVSALNIANGYTDSIATLGVTCPEMPICQDSDIPLPPYVAVSVASGTPGPNQRLLVYALP